MTKQVHHPLALETAQDPVTAQPLDHELIARLKASYTLLRERDTRFAERFYTRLFADAPQIRALFHDHPAVQAAKLTATLDAIVRNLEHPEWSAAMLSGLGRRHHLYGARPEHYPIVIDLMLDAMRETLLEAGSSADSVDRDIAEWRTAIEHASAQMIAATPDRT